MSLQDRKSGWTRTEIIQAISAGAAVMTVLMKILEFKHLSSTPTNVSDKKPATGYVRIGAINKKDVKTSVGVGQLLIPTRQPVTISPPKIPNSGDQIKVVRDVYVRSNVPKSPDYNPPEPSIQVLSPGQKLLVLEVHSIADPSQQHISVWAKIQY
jgi:hypothetical protein